MTFETTKVKIRQRAKDRVDLSFYNPKPVIRKYGWTQEKLAEILDVSLASINGIINGNPSIAQVKMLTDVIGCSFVEFFNVPGMDFQLPLPSANPNAVVKKLACPNCGAAFMVSTQVVLTPIDDTTPATSTDE